MLVVDEEAARYPWELLENRWDRSGTPIALNRGLLRQLELSRLRENPVQSLGTSVLVVGDPILDDNDQLALPGARAEATAVADLLERSKRFDVSRQIHARSGDIVRALFAKSYRVIHLAGHGVYEWPAPPRTAADAATKKASEPYVPTRPDAGRLVTGMVLGDGIFLTPAEIEQMRRVPELVFINCCHLGYIEDTERHNVQEATQAGVIAVARTDYNLFAANVATQFIRLGVRAVIAAGWAVDDAAGKTFALAFYEAMVNGQGFGAAVKIARQQTQAAHPYKNTWGAYQCYGDPDYVLVSTPAPREDSQSPFVAIEQVINQIENLTSEIESSGDDNVGAHLKQIASLRKLIDEDDAWRFIGRGWSALGAAYNCAFQFDDAVACYYTALGCEDGGLTVRDLEQLSNAESRAAVAKWITGVTDDERVKLEQQVQVAIQRLQAILDLPKAPKTVAVGAAAESWSSETRERLALLGSACKRKAWIAKNKTPRMEALENMRGFYERAKMLPGNAGDRAYPVINWIVSILVLDWHGKTASAKEESDVVEALEQRGRELKQQVKERRDPWDAASLADLKLITALRESKLDDATVDALAQDYADVKRFASARAYASMREQIEFLASMAALTSAKAKTKLDELLRMLSAGTASPAPSDDVGMPADSDGKTPKQRAPRRRARAASTGGTSKKRGRKKRTK